MTHQDDAAAIAAFSELLLTMARRVNAATTPDTGPRPALAADEAHASGHRWRVETRDGVADEWAPGTAYLSRHHAIERYEALTEHHPTWKDGTPVERRIVRETTTYTVEEPTAETLQPDTCRSVDVDGGPVLVRGSGDFTEQDAQFFGEVVRAAKQKYGAEHDPASDEYARRAARRDSLRHLAARASSSGLTHEDAALLREGIDAEIREHDTMRAVAAGNKRHVQTIAPEIDRLTDELEDAEKRASGFLADLRRAWGERDRAQAAIGRVRALASRWAVLRTHGSAATELRAALDGTEQPTEAS